LRHRLRQLGLLLADEPASVPDGADLFDEACDQAVRSFQQQRGLRIDGVVDRETHRGLDEARWRLGDRPLSFAVRHPYVGDDVAALQHRLIDMGFDCGRADGVFGAHTENALREFQRNVGLPADGACGPATFRALRQLARTVVGGKANELREYERLHHGGPTMAGKLVVIDPGHGGLDRGSTNSAGGVLDEASIVDDIANRVEGRLAAAGALAYRTRGGEAAQGLGSLDLLDRPPSDAERGAFANAAEADLLVSVHVDGHANPHCRGVSTYYYGTANDRSLVGARLAELIQQEILCRTDLLDCRSHPKTWELLRRTRMPAVRIELGYLTNPGDAARLGRPEFRDELAEAIVVAIQRLFSPAEIPTRESIELSRQTISV
ncbi:MAG TPA: N-acetylmuramoyl-L-alanine amidase, partial [Acidothermaceae bacterium]|nr:N-acetylmuramoyl-L-alanine amidase [Acidothermaceae bacterium]